jgi:hypothetical protein
MRTLAILTLFASALGMAACATYYDDGGRGGYGRSYGGYAYDGRDFDRPGNDCGFFGSSGGDRLDPWLACTPEGQGIVRSGFDGDDDRRLSARTAERANIWFRRHADSNRDMRLTDGEVRAALVNAERYSGRY